MEKMELFMTNLFNDVIKSIKSPRGEASLILKAFSKIEYGEITIKTPDKVIHKYTGKMPGPSVELDILEWSVFPEILGKSDIGLAETYMESHWNASSIENLIELSILNESALIDVFKGNWAKILFYRLKHEARENTKSGSKQNIVAHYDLGNPFYSLWLDRTMTYSSALFLNEEETLAEAQENKYQSMLDLIGAKPGDHILEVGCGWGGFMEYAAKKGFKVTGITISNEQFSYATERMKKHKLEENCEVRLCDYRDLTGTYDHAVSIEMIEAVGEKYWNSYFKLFKKVLKPGGKFAVQAIVIQDEKFESYRKGTDFIQQYIFPGGMLLSPKVIDAHLQKAGFNKERSIAFGKDYARTLNHWREMFNNRSEDVRALGFDEKFMKLWNFYLSYCEGAFLAGRIDVLQFSASV